MNSAFAVWELVGSGEPMRITAEGAEGAVAAPAGFNSAARAARPRSPWLPLGYAEAVLAWLESRRARPGLFGRFLGDRIRNRTAGRRRVESFLLDRFPELGEAHRLRWPDARPAATGEPIPTRRSRLRAPADELAESVRTVLAGRQLLGHELAAALAERGVALDAPFDRELDPLVHLGVVQRVAAVGWAQEGGRGAAWRCRRCASNAVGFYPCFRCGLEGCPQCDTCESLGRSTACGALYRLAVSEPAGGERVARPVEVRLPFALTPHQESIARQLAESARDAVVWAACGAGKTEVSYEAIRRVVSSGGRALFAVPRRDVVEQLGRRLASVFSGVDVVALFGGTPHKYAQAPIVVATVHQCLRFYQAFDLAVVDEVDAFPLNREPWLLDAVERALTPHGRWIAMSATPAQALLDRGGRSWDVHVLPARPHGRPLPVPEFARCASPGRDASGAGPGDLPEQKRDPWKETIRARVDESLARGRRVLVFVPSVKDGERVRESLLRCGPGRRWNDLGRGRGGTGSGWSGAGPGASLGSRLAGAAGGAPREPVIASVHAQDPARAEKVKAVEDGAIDVLVTTTILERGITLPHLDVIVFAADRERVWDAASLVQMAGRVGRSPLDPTGRVLFLSERVSPAMREACATIEELNRTAERLGLLVGDSEF